MDDAYSSDFGMILQELRKKQGLKQEQLADMIHKEKSIISRYEKNYQSPTFETVKAFARIFNVSLDYLAGMEKRDRVSLYNLTDSQVEIIHLLIALFRDSNTKTHKEINSDNYALIGRILDEFHK